MQSISSESIQGDPRSVRSRSWEAQSLAEPEISGLWDKNYEAPQVSALPRRAARSWTLTVSFIPILPLPSFPSVPLPFPAGLPGPKEGPPGPRPP